jgi:hypothetical protein
LSAGLELARTGYPENLFSWRWPEGFTELAVKRLPSDMGIEGQADLEAFRYSFYN